MSMLLSAAPVFAASDESSGENGEVAPPVKAKMLAPVTVTEEYGAAMTGAGFFSSRAAL